ncbi:hypothetical protein HELRODRAFT_171627 [Helobdella robusta]|uniref:Endonuclease/exonuclease/phosphatase domain-containing protein n=1 Tax=Helobdella robusta TaxID=6412 RepID=T1F4H2_HELRO|nr:hypothetical protein HELRODRAFT_171627 [Helobdella robusta]ESO05266.1 hypothetical protein HELRODRAFT_171627 [Helobdella robusta]
MQKISTLKTLEKTERIFNKVNKKLQLRTWLVSTFDKATHSEHVSAHLCPKTSSQQALSGQGVPRIPGKYAIAEGCCRKIQNGPSMVLRLGTLNVGSLTGRSMEIAEMLERRRIDICCLQETR